MAPPKAARKNRRFQHGFKSYLKLLNGTAALTASTRASGTTPFIFIAMRFVFLSGKHSVCTAFCPQRSVSELIIKQVSENTRASLVARRSNFRIENESAWREIDGFSRLFPPFLGWTLETVAGAAASL